VLARKPFATLDVIGDEAAGSLFYAVWRWRDGEAARASHRDPELNELRARLHRLALVTHAITGVREPGHAVDTDDRLAAAARDRRRGFERRVEDTGRAEGDRRLSVDRRVGPRRQVELARDLVGAARRAREHAVAPFSRFKVGAALETVEGLVITGCNVENATYGLTICAERVAMFNALSHGYREFRRIAIVADTESPTPPCGACRQILWELGGNLEICLANLTTDKGTYWLKDLLPLPFDARLLKL
jgi:cytidine deaminase